ncbi:MAG: hypothetical protein GC200_02055 [Tepidisphaera sp.]|nr:hypothetical protein [Tepidisphaera sp.]
MSEDSPSLGFNRDPELGDVLVVRSNAKNAIATGVVWILGGIGALFGVFSAAHHASSGRGHATGLPIEGQILLGIFALGLLVSGCVTLYSGRDKHVFYEQGVARYRKQRRIASIRYADADEMRMEQSRQYHKGRYIGTSITLKWFKEGHQIYTHSSRYKETLAKGGMVNLFRHNFIETPTDLDPVRDIAASTLSPRFVESLAQGETLELAKGHSASAQGLTPAGGSLKGQLVPYAAIEDMQIKDFKLHVMSGGKEIFSCPTSARNFWPKFYALQEFWLAAVESGNTEPTADVQAS